MNIYLKIQHLIHIINFKIIQNKQVIYFFIFFLIIYIHNNKGYCLGLLISQNIVLELGNKEFQGILIKSKVNEGSEFTFSIESKFN